MTARPKSTPRGQERRQALLDAAAELITAGGFASVSHRALARHTGLPLAATTYYFTSLDDVLDAATAQLTRQWLEQARAALDALPTRPTEHAVIETILSITGVLPGEPGASRRRGDLLALYERYLEAGRTPRLSAAVTTYNAEVESLLIEALRQVLPDTDTSVARLVLAQLDGAVLRALAEGDDPSTAGRRGVGRLVALLQASGSRAAEPTPRPDRLGTETTW